MDTVVLNKKDCGMRYNVYVWELFFLKAPSGYSYRPRTDQDRNFLNDTTPRYFLVFNDAKGRKVFEGLVEHGDMVGPVTYYYKSGMVKRREFWGDNSSLDPGTGIEWADAPYENGVWTFYDKRGVRRKEWVYTTVSGSSSLGAWHFRIRVRNRYRKNGAEAGSKYKVMDHHR